MKHCLSPPITNTEPGEQWIVVRPLQVQDFNRGYLKLLSQLTTVGNVTQQSFEGTSTFLNSFRRCVSINYMNYDNTKLALSSLVLNF